MPSAEIVGGTISDHYIGETTLANPILVLEVDGEPVASAYVIQQVGNSKRFIFPKKVGTSVYLMAMGQVFGNDLPALNISVRIFVAE